MGDNKTIRQPMPLGDNYFLNFNFSIYQRNENPKKYLESFPIRCFLLGPSIPISKKRDYHRIILMPGTMM